MNIRLPLLVAATLATSASAATISGAGSVTVDGTTYAFWGIELPAPETGSGRWPAGQLAQQALVAVGRRHHGHL